MIYCRDFANQPTIPGTPGSPSFPTDPELPQEPQPDDLPAPSDPDPYPKYRDDPLPGSIDEAPVGMLANRKVSSFLIAPLATDRVPTGFSISHRNGCRGTSPADVDQAPWVERANWGIKPWTRVSFTRVAVIHRIDPPLEN